MVSRIAAIADSRPAFIVCGSDAPQTIKDRAHVVADGTGAVDTAALQAAADMMGTRPVEVYNSFWPNAAVTRLVSDGSLDGTLVTFINAKIYDANVAYPGVGINIGGTRADTGATFASSTLNAGTWYLPYASITTAPAVGDRLCLVAADTTTSSQPFGPIGGSPERPGENMAGEWMTVESIDTTAKVITLRYPLRDTYDLSKTFKLFKYNLPKRGRIVGKCEIVGVAGTGHPTQTPTSNRSQPFHLSYVDSWVIDGVEANTPYARHGIGVFECLDTWTTNARMRDVNDLGANTSYEGYGVRYMGCEGGGITNGFNVHGCRHFSEVNGGQSGYGLSTVTRPISRNVKVHTIRGHHTWAALCGDHPGSEGTTYHDIDAFGCSGTVFARGKLPALYGRITGRGGHHLVGPYGAVVQATVSPGTAVAVTVDSFHVAKLTSGSSYTLGSGLSTSETVTVSSISGTTVTLASVANTHNVGEIIGSPQGNDHMITIGEQPRDTSGNNLNTTRGGWCGTGLVIDIAAHHDMGGNGSPFASGSSTVHVVHPLDGATIKLGGFIKPTNNAVTCIGDYARDSLIEVTGADMSAAFSGQGWFVYLNPSAQSPTVSAGQYVSGNRITVIGGVKPRSGGVYVAGSADSANPSEGNAVQLWSRLLGTGLTSSSPLLTLGTNPNGGTGYHRAPKVVSWRTPDVNALTAVSTGSNVVNGLMWEGYSEFADLTKSQDCVIVPAGSPLWPDTAATTATLDLAAAHGIAYLYRVKVCGQVMTKAAVYCSTVGTYGTDFGYRVAAYADDGTGFMPQLAAPLHDAGRIQVPATGPNYSSTFSFKTPDAGYMWVSTNQQYDTLPTAFPIMAQMSTPLLASPVGGPIPSGTAVDQARFRKMTGAGSTSTSAAPTLSGLTDEGTARTVGYYLP